MQVPAVMWQCYTEEVEELLRLDTLLRFNLGNGPSQLPAVVTGSIIWEVGPIYHLKRV